MKKNIDSLKIILITGQQSVSLVSPDYINTPNPYNSTISITPFENRQLVVTQAGLCHNSINQTYRFFQSGQYILKKDSYFF